jgi:hypothetical protein
VTIFRHRCQLIDSDQIRALVCLSDRRRQALVERENQIFGLRLN